VVHCRDVQKGICLSAIYGVSVKNTPSGADYDVIASWNQRLVYVEVKSSPPKGIEQNEISTFFSRMDDILRMQPSSSTIRN